MIVGYSKKAQTKMALALILPALLIVSVFTYIPSAYVFFLSFEDWDMISPIKTNVGLANYKRLFDPANGFGYSLTRTLVYSLIFIPMTLCLSLFIANRINKLSHKGKGVYQSLFFIPSVTSISVISLVWSYLFNPQIGPINAFLAKLGVSSDAMPQWLNSCDLALPTLAIIGVWQNIGFMTLLFVAGLQNIPKIYYEAAEIDGAPKRLVFYKITIPLLSPVLYYVLFMLIINSFKMFDIVAIMTKGKPQGSTNVILYYVYQRSFQFWDAGIGAAASWVIFIILLGIYMLQQKLGEKNVHY